MWGQIDHLYTNSSFSGIQILKQARSRNEGTGPQTECLLPLDSQCSHAWQIHCGSKDIRLPESIRVFPWASLGHRHVLQHPSVSGRGFWVLTSAWLLPHPDLPKYEKLAKEPSSFSPRARAPGSLFHPLSYVSTMSNSENENEKSRRTDLSGPHGLEDLGKGPTCLCPLWGHVRRKPL